MADYDGEFWNQISRDMPANARRQMLDLVDFMLTYTSKITKPEDLEEENLEAVMSQKLPHLDAELRKMAIKTFYESINQAMVESGSKEEELAAAQEASKKQTEKDNDYDEADEKPIARSKKSAQPQHDHTEDEIDFDDHTDDRIVKVSKPPGKKPSSSFKAPSIQDILHQESAKKVAAASSKPSPRPFVHHKDQQQKEEEVSINSNKSSSSSPKQQHPFKKPNSEDDHEKPAASEVKPIRSPSSSSPSFSKPVIKPTLKQASAVPYDNDGDDLSTIVKPVGSMAIPNTTTTTLGKKKKKTAAGATTTTDATDDGKEAQVKRPPNKTTYSKDKKIA